jgi:hypothetical protein
MFRIHQVSHYDLVSCAWTGNRKFKWDDNDKINNLAYPLQGVIDPAQVEAADSRRHPALTGEFASPAQL